MHLSTQGSSDSFRGSKRKENNSSSHALQTQHWYLIHIQDIPIQSCIIQNNENSIIVVDCFQYFKNVLTNRTRNPTSFARFVHKMKKPLPFFYQIVSNFGSDYGSYFSKYLFNSEIDTMWKDWLVLFVY